MSRMTQKGQVTIPKDIRSVLDLKTGDEVVFKVEKSRKSVRIVKKTPARENLKNYVGYLTHLEGRSPDEIVQSMRGEPDDSRG